MDDLICSCSPLLLSKTTCHPEFASRSLGAKSRKQQPLSVDILLLHSLLPWIYQARHWDLRPSTTFRPPCPAWRFHKDSMMSLIASALWSKAESHSPSWLPLPSHDRLLQFLCDILRGLSSLFWKRIFYSQGSKLNQTWGHSGSIHPLEVE